ncbi:hypothetical protein AYO41_03845 [Verrucomicrobia bacterium SCGC AG-212-E04]|nr:hypothetical protein AYO41_03845 [Verrucomicrobia bacterium SCGC AG-212-E04]
MNPGDGFELGANRYGKARVRIAKVVRRAESVHDLREFTVDVLATGDFTDCFVAGENAHILPTDTIKNTVYALAAKHEIRTAEEFGALIGQHLLAQSEFMSSVTATLSELSWERIAVDGKPHPHAFVQRQPFRWIAEVTTPRGGAPRFTSGVDDVRVIKTTASAFSGFLQDAWTTLPETRDRIFSTLLKARWEYRAVPEHFVTSNVAALDAMLRVFATEFSESVQATLFSMGRAAMTAVPEIERVTIAMPNRHYLSAPLIALGLEDHREVFVPIDEPHGQIEATVERTK